MADRIVIDASVGVARVRPEIASRAVRRAFSSWSVGRSRLIVPRLFWLEIVNALGGRHRYPASEIAEALRELDELGLETVEIGRGPLPLKIPTHGVVLLKFVRAPSAQSIPHASSVRPFAAGASF